MKSAGTQTRHFRAHRVPMRPDVESAREFDSGGVGGVE
jgi:hypothetical protein